MREENITNLTYVVRVLSRNVAAEDHPEHFVG